MSLKPVTYNQPENLGQMLLVYGKSGVGKSSLMAQLARASEDSGRFAVIGDTELGSAAALRRAGCKEAKAFDLSQQSGIKDAMQLAQGALADPQTGMICNDTLTELAITALRAAMGNRDFPELRDYGQRKFSQLKVLRNLRDVASSGRAVLITAQEGLRDVEGMAAKIVPEVPRGDREDLISQMDAVAHLRVARKADADQLGLTLGQRFLDFREDPKRTTKLRDAAPWLAWGMRPDLIFALEDGRSAVNLYNALTYKEADK